MAAGTVTKKVETQAERPLEENINRLQIEGEEARTVDEAISILRYSLVLIFGIMKLISRIIISGTHFLFFETFQIFRIHISLQDLNKVHLFFEETKVIN